MFTTHSESLKSGENKITPWNRVLLEKLTVTEVVKKFLVLYGTRSFVAAFTRARQFLYVTPNLTDNPLPTLRN
jgi:hypothetical protein